MHSKLLAKPKNVEVRNKTLKKHSEAVKRTALTLMDNYGIHSKIEKNSKIEKDLLKKYITFSSLFHDLGKSDIRFQNRMSGKTKKRKINHPLLSLPFLKEGFKELESDQLLEDLCILSVASHHTPLWKNLYQNNRKQEIELNDEIRTKLNDIFTKWNYEIDIEEIEESNPYKEFYKSYRSAISKLNQDTLLYRSAFSYISGILSRADHLVSSGAWLNKTVHPYEFFDRSSYTDYQENAFNFKGNLFITLPTGLGKTETSLNWFKNQDVNRLFYVLPTRSTINSMYKRLSELYIDSVGILHSSYKTFLYSEENEEDFYKHQNLQRNIIVTTPDQLILSLMNKGHFGENELLFSDSAFIFDEIHTYSPKTFYLIKYMLEYLNREFNTPQCIMSATFPDFLKNQFSFLNAKDLLSNSRTNEIYEGLDRVEPNYRDKELQKDMNKIIKDYNDNKSVLIVLNTVNRSKNIYNRLVNSEKIEDNDIELLHSRFIRKDRKNKEDKIDKFEEKNGKIFVSTQIVEVSLDISYDVLYTEICPIDSLSQRLGRVNRKINFDSLQNSETSSAFVYEPETELPYENLKKSREVVKWLSKNYNNESDLLKANNKFYEKIKENITAKDKNEYQEIWKELKFIQSPRLEEEKYQKLLKTRSGLITISGVPKKFLENIKTLEKEKKNKSIKEKRLINIKEQQFLTKIPIYLAKDHILQEQSKDLGINIFDLHYNSKTGIEIKDNDGAFMI